MKVVLAGGQEIDLGTTEARPTVGIIDYSRRVTDEFGVTTVVERGFAQRMSVRLALPFAQVDALQQRLAALRATPARWVVEDGSDWLDFEGFYKEFSLDLNVPPLSYCTLTVEGLADTDIPADPGGDPAVSGSASTLLLLDPVTVTDAVLAASSVPENDHPAWNAVQSYAAGDRVIVGHRIYESAAAGNLGNDPAAATGQWFDVGPTNRWAMFDQALGTATATDGTFSVTLSGGGANAVALLDVVGASVQITADGYGRTLPVSAGALTFLDLPPVTGTITITVTGTGVKSVGTLLLGKVVGLGVTEASPTAGINDFSRKETDDFGAPVVVERAWAKRISAQALIRSDALDLVANRIAAVRAKPALWIGGVGLDSLTIYGFFKDFSVEVGENVSTLSLSIEGLSEAAPLKDFQDLIDPPNWTEIVDDDPVSRPRPQDGATDGAVLGDNLYDANGNLFIPEDILNNALSLDPSGRLLQAVPGGASIVLGQIDPALFAEITSSVDRQVQDDIGKLAASLIRFSLAEKRVTDVFRDAGLYTDPATGVAKLYAIEERARQLNDVEVKLDAARASIELRATVQQLTDVSGSVTEVSQALNALAGVVETKASNTTVTDQDTRLTSAEQTLSALDGTISQSVTSALRQPSAADLAASGDIKSLILLDSTRRRQTVALAFARTELGAMVRSATEAEAFERSRLGVLIGSVSANVTADRIARIEGDQAIAGRLNTISTTAGGRTATIEEFAETIDAVNAKVGVRLDVDGYVTGWALNNDGAKGDMVIRVDKLAIGAPGKPNFAVFDLVGETLYINGLLKARTVDAQMLKVNGVKIENLDYGAVGKTSFYQHALEVALPSANVWTAIQGVGVHVDYGAPIDGTFTFYARGTGSVGASTVIYVRVVRVSDGTVVWGGSVDGLPINIANSAGFTPVPGTFTDTIPAGQRGQYDVQVKCTTAAVSFHMRTQRVHEQARVRFDEIQLYTPAAGVGPGAGDGGGGSINGDTSGEGGTSGTSGDGSSTRGGLAQKQHIVEN